MVGRTALTFRPPVPEALRWLDGVTHPEHRPLINVSQAAPVEPPPDNLRAAMAHIVTSDPGAHLYGPVLGLPELRAQIANDWSEAYGGSIAQDQTAITSGCNQAFAATIATLCSEGDEIILPVPYYFSHQMWLDMSGVRAVHLPVGLDMLPDPDAAAQRITPRTRAITLVSPNNPCGVEYPADLLQAFFDLARRHRIALIVDETYRNFDSRPGPPHPLFTDPHWDDTLIHLYSFSKAYRLTGHRVGAVVAGRARLAEMEKFLDAVMICPSQLGQRAALWGMQNLSDWVAGERREILARKAAIAAHIPQLEAKGWQLLGCGAYFAYLQHPFSVSSADLAPRLLRDVSVLLLPGTMFMPSSVPRGREEVRIAFANVDVGNIKELINRLASLPH